MSTNKKPMPTRGGTYTRQSGGNLKCERKGNDAPVHRTSARPAIDSADSKAESKSTDKSVAKLGNNKQEPGK